jgi:hypothetical protein
MHAMLLSMVAGNKKLMFFPAKKAIDERALGGEVVL